MKRLWFLNNRTALGMSFDTGYTTASSDSLTAYQLFRFDKLERGGQAGSGGRGVERILQQPGAGEVGVGGRGRTECERIEAACGMVQQRASTMAFVPAGFRFRPIHDQTFTPVSREQLQLWTQS